MKRILVGLGLLVAGVAAGQYDATIVRRGDLLNIDGGLKISGTVSIADGGIVTANQGKGQDGGAWNVSGQVTLLCTDANGVTRPCRGDDAGYLLTATAPGYSGASVGTVSGELCVSAAYDGGALYDAGSGVALQTYSVLVAPSDMVGFKLCNSSTSTQVNWLCGARNASVPVVGATGNILESRGAGTGAYLGCEARNFTEVACPEIHFSVASNQTSGVDGGTGCVRFEIAR